MIRSRAGMNQDIPPPGQVTLADYIEKVQEEEKSPLEKLMELDCNVASAVLEDLDDLARMADVVPEGQFKYFTNFIETVELFQRSRIKPIPALFKKGP